MNKNKKKKVSKKKKTIRKKKTVKKVTTAALAVVSYQDIVQPETHKGKLSVVSTYFPKRTLEFITGLTPAKYIQERKGPDNKMFKYIPGWYAKKCANYAFGFNHSVEIKTKEIVGLSAIVEGRLIINDPKTGKQILFKDDIGSHKIRFTKGKANTPENAVDIGNDYKSAATDALKRCMVQIGFFSDVYGPNEYKVETGGDIQNTPKSDAPSIDIVLDKNTKTCSKCDAPISEAGAQISKKIFGKQLCKEHFNKLSNKKK